MGQGYLNLLIRGIYYFLCHVNVIYRVRNHSIGINQLNSDEITVLPYLEYYFYLKILLSI